MIEDRIEDFDMSDTNSLLNELDTSQISGKDRKTNLRKSEQKISESPNRSARGNQSMNF
jgi:hypothetical protein